MGDPRWRRFEHDVQNRLHLDSTPGSGNQFFAPGDAVDHRHLLLSRFPILADCKYTEKLSFTLNSHFLHQQVERATELGKRFVMPIRFSCHGDYVVLTLDDLAELLP